MASIAQALVGQDVAAMRAYVTAGDNFANMAEDTVALNVSHSNLKQQWWELRFDRHTTILGVKERVYKHCGSLVEDMTLVLKSNGQTIAILDDDSKMLGYYSPINGMELHVVDRNPNSISANGALENVSLVKKYRMSDEDYDKRKNTLRQYKRDQLKKDPNFKFKMGGGAGGPPGAAGAKKPLDPPATEESCKDIKVDMRCEVVQGGKRGRVAFVGEAPALGNGGWWVGVEMDEPLGKHDGEVKGKRYFQCGAKRGLMIKPKHIKVGDFPEIDEFASDDDGR